MEATDQRLMADLSESLSRNSDAVRRLQNLIQDFLEQKAAHFLHVGRTLTESLSQHAQSNRALREEMALDRASRDAHTQALLANNSAMLEQARALRQHTEAMAEHTQTLRQHTAALMQPRRY
jgi:hypothetical protein